MTTIEIRLKDGKHTFYKDKCDIDDTKLLKRIFTNIEEKMNMSFKKSMQGELPIENDWFR